MDLLGYIFFMDQFFYSIFFQKTVLEYEKNRMERGRNESAAGNVVGMQRAFFFLLFHMKTKRGGSHQRSLFFSQDLYSFCVPLSSPPSFQTHTYFFLVPPHLENPHLPHPLPQYGCSILLIEAILGQTLLSENLTFFLANWDFI